MARQCTLFRTVEANERKAEREQNKEHEGYNILKELFVKHNVDFTKDFKINTWSNKEQEAFKKGMQVYGYESLIKYYL